MKNVIIITGSIVGVLGITLLALHLSKKGGDNDPTQTLANAKNIDQQIQALMNIALGYNTTERGTLIKGKLNTGEMTRMLFLMKQWQTNKKGMTKAEKEELYRLLNRVFNS
jgi:hypothetical protein